MKNQREGEIRMARIHVVGGTGFAGGHIVAEAARRGHQVASLSRHVPEATVDGVDYRTGDVQDEATVRSFVDGADVAVEALSPRGALAEPGTLRGIVSHLAELTAGAGARLGVVGGAGSLHVAPGGPLLHDTEAFPAAFKAEAVEMGGVLDDLRAGDPSLDWFVVSPAAAFGAQAPGEATGHYRVGSDVLLADEEGQSAISGADFATAFVDEIETPRHHRERFTVAY